MTDNREIWLEETWRKLLLKLETEAERTGANIPFFPVEGRYRDNMMPDGLSWWTNGFWSGILWQLYHVTGNRGYRETAMQICRRMEEPLATFDKLHHDVGFQYLPAAVMAWKQTGDEKARSMGLHAASLLAGRFNPAGNFIRAWNESRWSEDVSGWMIVDSLLNLPLLYWASEETEDPRYADIAERHAHTALRALLREDGSCSHIASFDARTGEFLGEVPGQGYGVGSAWSRGQAWAVYGFSNLYRLTRKKEYLDAAKRCAHYCISALSANDWVALADFRAPKEPVKLDVSAGAIIACGLLELEEHVPELEKDLYHHAAVEILAVCTERFSDWNPETDGILGASSTMYHDERLANLSFIYGDYFLLEGILRLKKEALLMW